MDELKKAYRLATIIGIAMIASLFVYAAVVEIIKMNYESFKGFAPFPGIEILRYIFFGIAILEFFLIRYVKNLILSGRSAVEGLPRQKRPFSPNVQRLFTTAIVTYAFCESVVIYGLVLFLIAGSSLDFYLFMVLSLFFYAIYFPRYNQWEEYISQANKIGEPIN